MANEGEHYDTLQCMGLHDYKRITFKLILIQFNLWDINLNMRSKIYFVHIGYMKSQESECITYYAIHKKTTIYRLQ